MQDLLLGREAFGGGVYALNSDFLPKDLLNKFWIQILSNTTLNHIQFSVTTSKSLHLFAADQTTERRL